jgi:hypothetical protein
VPPGVRHHAALEHHVVEECPEIARDAVAIGADALWCQIGVINLEGARIAEEGGVTVVMDRCLKVEHARYIGRRHWLGFNTQPSPASAPGSSKPLPASRPPCCSQPRPDRLASGHPPMRAVALTDVPGRGDRGSPRPRARLRRPAECHAMPHVDPLRGRLRGRGQRDLERDPRPRYGGRKRWVRGWW